MEEEQIILSPREIFRITIVGDHKSGKTTFIKKNFMMDQFKNKNNYTHKMYIPGFEETNELSIQPTLNIDFFYKNKLVNGIAYKIIIVDTPGHPAFKPMTEMYYTNYDALVITFDLASEREFSNLQNWLQIAKNLNPEFNQKNKTIFLLGISKGKQYVSDSDIYSFANRHQLTYLKYSLTEKDVLDKIITNGIKNKLNGRISNIRKMCIQENDTKDCYCNLM